MKDCRECQHSQYAKGSYFCMALTIPKPASWMRDDRNDCGLEARMFDERAEHKYSEYEG